jgi:hypothetical protein
MADAFPGDRPAIIDDLVKHLTDVELFSIKLSINEEEEFANKKPIMPSSVNDEML